MFEFAMQGWKIQLNAESVNVNIEVTRIDGAIVSETESDILGDRGEKVLSYEFTAEHGLVPQDLVFMPMKLVVGNIALELQVTKTGELQLFCWGVNGASLEHSACTNGAIQSPACELECIVLPAEPCMFLIEYEGMSLTCHYDESSDQVYMTVLSDKPRNDSALVMLLSMAQKRAMQHGYVGVVEGKSLFWYDGQSSPLYNKNKELFIFEVSWQIETDDLSAEHAVASVCNTFFTSEVLKQQPCFYAKKSRSEGVGHAIDSRNCVVGEYPNSHKDEAKLVEYSVVWSKHVVARSSEESAKMIAAEFLQSNHDARTFEVKKEGANDRELIYVESCSGKTL